MVFDYALSLFKADETPLGRFPIDVDWEPALEWCQFAAMRRGSAETKTRAIVAPLWHRQRHAPYVEGFSVALEGEAPASFPLEYFAADAERVARRLIENGKLERGAAYLYSVLAYRAQAENSCFKAPFTVEDASPPFDIRDVSLEDAICSATVLGPNDPDDMPALFPWSLLEETKRLAQHAGSNETGGILVGHVCRDPSSGEIFVQVNAQIHATDARADSTSLHFTSQTWSDLRAALDLRGEGESLLGWWHSHPVASWCRKCPPERQRECALSEGFFSAHDRALQRTVFPKAHSLGLVVNAVGCGDFTHSLFGWKKGLLLTRGLHVTNHDSI